MPRNAKLLMITLITLVAVALAACAKRQPGSSTPTVIVPSDAIAQVRGDELRYPIETRADGGEVWNVDAIHFWLVDGTTHELVLGPDGKPLASGLLQSQAANFMTRHPEIENTTAWAVRVTRSVQVVRRGKVIERERDAIVEEFDLDSLVARAKAAKPE